MIAVPSVVICGFGRRGQAVGSAILTHATATNVTVVERGFLRSQMARACGFRTICGDASVTSCMRVAHIGTADDVIICISGPSGSNAVRIARDLAPSALIQVGASHADCRGDLIAAGADAVIIIPKIAGGLLADSLNI